jgi:hypothetical protein
MSIVSSAKVQEQKEVRRKPARNVKAKERLFKW